MARNKEFDVEGALDAAICPYAGIAACAFDIAVRLGARGQAEGLQRR